MKKVSLFMMFIVSCFVFQSCSDSDDDSKEVFSTLKPEEHKKILEDQGVKFVGNLDKMSKLEVYEVIGQFSNLMNMVEDDDVFCSPLRTVLGQIEAVKKSPIASPLFFTSDDELQSITNLFKEEAGKYVWNSNINNWDKTAATDQITYKFKNESNQDVVISLYELKLHTVSNKHQFSDGKFIEFPTSVKMKVSVGNVTLATFVMSGSYDANDTPTLLSSELFVEGYKIVSKLTNSSNKLVVEGSFIFEKEELMSMSADFDANISFDSVLKQLAEAEEKGFPFNQEILTKANLTAKVMDIKLVGFVDVKPLLKEFDVEKKPSMTVVSNVLNQHTKLGLWYTSKNEKIANGEFYKKSESFEGIVEESLGLNLIFGDGSKIDSSIYFGDGFDKLTSTVQQWMEIMQNLNKK